MSKLVVVSIEDSDADYYMIEMALHQCLPDLSIERAYDGEKAIQFFERARSARAILPNLVLLDRNLPRKDGFEVLAYLNAESLTSQLPVVMFTSSITPQERRKALALGARDVIIKPTDLDDLLARLKHICDKQLPFTTAR